VLFIVWLNCHVLLLLNYRNCMWYIRSVYHINQFVMYEDGYVTLYPLTSQSGKYIVGY
jgi:hypothetical protein